MHNKARHIRTASCAGRHYAYMSLRKQRSMKKAIAVILLALMPSITYAESQVAIGIGQPYGGFLGGRFSALFERTKIYLGAGLLGYTSSSGSMLGYNAGFDCQIGSSNHSLGVSYGTVTANGADSIYIGTSYNYAYYFSGFTERSWIIGLSSYEGKQEKTNIFGYRDKKSGTFINVGFQY